MAKNITVTNGFVSITSSATTSIKDILVSGNLSSYNQLPDLIYNTDVETDMLSTSTLILDTPNVTIDGDGGSVDIVLEATNLSVIDDRQYYSPGVMKLTDGTITSAKIWIDGYSSLIVSDAGDVGDGDITLLGSLHITKTGSYDLVNNILHDNTPRNPVTGNRALHLTGAGSNQIRVSGTNTFKGHTISQSNNLLIGNALALQNSTLNITSGGLVFDSGITAPVFGGLAGSVDFELITTSSENVTLTIGDNNEDTEYSGIISGAGDLVKNGTGTFTSTASNSYTGTTTLNDGTIAFNCSSTQLLSGVISGSGALAVGGGGTLTLSAVNTYIGTTTINTGTLTISDSGQLGSGNYSADIINDGTLTFDSDADQTLSGVISGTGNIVKNNSNTLTITSNNTYTGTAIVNSGILDCGDYSTIANTTINAGGALALGLTSTRSITINGNLELATLSTLYIQFNTDTDYVDSITLTGDLTIDAGSVLDVSDLGSSPALAYGLPVTIIDYSGAWNSGTFLGLPDSHYFLMAGNYYLIAYSGTVMLTMIDPADIVGQVTAPVTTAATSITNDGFTANWTSDDHVHAAHYYIDISTDASFATYTSPYIDYGVGHSLSVAITGLAAATTYYYRVRAAGSVSPIWCNSDDSNVTSVTTDS